MANQASTPALTPTGVHPVDPRPVSRGPLDAVQGGPAVRLPVPPVPGTWLRALILPLIVLAWLVPVVLVGWLLSHLTRTLVLVALAGVLAFAFGPLANRLARWMPYSIALGLAYVLGLGLVLGLGSYVLVTAAAQVSSLLATLSAYDGQAQALQPQLTQLVAPLGVPADAVTHAQQQAIADLRATGSAVSSESVLYLARFFGAVIDLVLVLILSVYLAANGARIARWLKTETPHGTLRYRAHLLVGVTSRVIGGYIRGILGLAVLIGLLVGGGLAALGVPYAVLLGVLAFFMEFVPILGVIVSGAAALGIALVSFQDLVHPLLVLGYFALVHVIEGDVVGPRIMGKAVGIHPATGLIALAAGSELFGIWGALFAAPVAGLLQAILTAAWLEFQGSKPKEVLAAVTEPGQQQAGARAEAKAQEKMLG
jgi:predicted PurR-regulated permease PerM